MKPAWSHARVLARRESLGQRSTAHPILVLVVILLGTGCGGHTGPTAPPPPTTGGTPSPTSFSASIQGVYLANYFHRTETALPSGSSVTLGPLQEVEVDILIGSPEQASADLMPYPGFFGVQSTGQVAANAKTPHQFFLTGKGEIQGFLVSVGNDPFKPDWTSDRIPYHLTVN